MNLEKLEKYLIEQETIITEEDKSDQEMFGLLVNLACSLDPDTLDDDQYDLLGEILSGFGLITPEREDDSEEDEGDEDEDLEEKRIQKIKRSQHLKAHRAYKKHKAQLKMQNKRFRRSAKYKMWKRRHARMVKAGRTKRKKYV